MVFCKIENQIFFLAKEVLPAFHVDFHSKEDFSGEKFSLLPDDLSSFSRIGKEKPLTPLLFSSFLQSNEIESTDHSQCSPGQFILCFMNLQATFFSLCTIWSSNTQITTPSAGLIYILFK
jgi:hypothetical protein